MDGQQEVNFRALFHHLPQAMLLVDPPSGTILDANQAACRLLSRPRDELVGLEQAAIHPPQDCHRCRPILKDSLSQGQRVVEKISILRPSGELVAVEMAVTGLPAQTRPIACVIFQEATPLEQSREDLERHRRQLRALFALHETSLHIISRLDVDSVLEAIVVRAANLLDAQTAEVYLHRPAMGDLKSAASTGLPQELVEGVLKPGEGVAGRVLQTGTPLIVDDYDSWEGNVARYKGLGFSRVVGVPIKYGQDPLGVLVVDRPPRLPAFDDSDVNLLGLLANLAAIALENAHLHDETRQQLSELSAIEEIVGELASTLDFDNVIRLVLDKALEATAASTGVIGIADGEAADLLIVAHRGYSGEGNAQAPTGWSMAEGLLGRVFSTGEPALLKQMGEGHHYTRLLSTTRSQLAVPIKRERDVAGAIILESPHPDGFTQQHVTFVHHLAEHAAVAMGNAQLYQRMRESEERYRAYVENIPDAIWEADAQGRFTYWSPQIRNLTGYSPEELLGHSAYERLIHPDDVGEFRSVLRQMTQEGREEYVLRHRALRRDGSTLHMEVSVRPRRDRAGGLIKYGGVARDASEQMRLQTQLIQSAKLSAIGQMISGVAHELNNPLTTVMGYTQLLLACDLDDDVKADLERIYADALRAQRIVQNLLTFARQKKPQRSPTDVNEVIERALTLRRHQLNLDDVEVHVELAEDLPWTMADGDQLLQVFLNVINNAHQAMSQGDGGGVLTIRSALIGAQSIRVTFTDTGPGIPHEVLDKLFDPFFTTKEIGAGTGLGLSVSHGIIQEHGGHIWAESEAGQGARFVIELPVKSWAEELPDHYQGDGTEQAAGRT